VLIAPAALEAASAGGGPIEENPVACGKPGDLRSDGKHLSGTFVAHHDGFSPAEGIVIRMAKASGPDPNQHLVGLGVTHPYIINDEAAIAVSYRRFTNDRI